MRRARPRIVPALTPQGTRATAVVALLALAAITASIAAAPDLRGMLGAGLALLMLAIAVVDAQRFIIPDELTATSLALAFVYAAVIDPQAVWESIALAALRGAVLALVFLGVRAVHARLRGREGLGLGDVKLAGVAGAWLDWLTIPIAVEIAALAALAIYLMRNFLRGRPIRATGRLPFGLFLAPAIWLSWLIETVLLVPF